MIALESAIGQKARYVRTEDLDGYLRQQKFDLKTGGFGERLAQALNLPHNFRIGHSYLANNLRAYPQTPVSVGGRQSPAAGRKQQEVQNEPTRQRQNTTERVRGSSPLAEGCKPVAQWLTEGDSLELAKLAKLLSVKNYSAKTVTANRGALARVMAQRVLWGLERNGAARQVAQALNDEATCRAAPNYALTLYTLSVCPDMHP